MSLYLGIDVGGTKTHALVIDETGQIISFGEAGPGNHQNVGYAGMLETLRLVLKRAIGEVGLDIAQIQGAGFGIAGYDWPSETPEMAAVIDQLGIQAPYQIVNDALLGLAAGSSDGWGVAVISGTGCNCRGWDQGHRREGRVTGYGVLMGEAAGASEIVFRAMQLVGYAWEQRIQPTELSKAFIEYVKAKDLEDLIEGYTRDRYVISAEAASLIFRVARSGDVTARRLVHWAGCELGEMAQGVIRQLGFENLTFDVVYSGSMFENGAMLIEPMQETVRRIAPQAHFVHLAVPPVIGAAVLGLEQAGITVDQAMRTQMIASIKSVRKNGSR